ncbi:hypothetical protein DEO72_LG5g1733 [Vigna unguiculata]|nr:hypothetical protein DEO72_LG5g1733 [Vigna unguiculata]
MVRFSSPLLQIHEGCHGCRCRCSGNSMEVARLCFTGAGVNEDGGVVAAAVACEARWRCAGCSRVAEVCEQGRRRLNCGGVAEVTGICAICGGASEEDARNWCRFVVAGCVNGGCRSCAVVCGLSFTVARWWFMCGRLRWCVAGEGGAKEEDGWWLP